MDSIGQIGMGLKGKGIGLGMDKGERKIRIKIDFERVWNAKEDVNFVNKIFN